MRRAAQRRSPRGARFYTPILAAIHQKYFEQPTPRRRKALLALLRRSGVRRGTVVDLACGAGGWARELTRSGYGVVGVDVSPAMIRLARKRAPRARFLCDSMTRVSLPPCDAVTGLGEPLNYLLRPGQVRRVFSKCCRALRAGGVLAVDTVEPPRGRRRIVRERVATLGQWRMTAQIVEHPSRRSIVRRITLTRRGRASVRETHRQRMYSGNELVRWLRRAGFHARVMRGEQLALSPRHCVVIARKP